MEEGGERFKDFIFRELVAHIDSRYTTSGFNVIVGHSDGAEYNHLLMLQKKNPFRGFINISENLNNDAGELLAAFFRDYDGRNLYYFIASAGYDSPDRIEAGETIDSLYRAAPNPRIAFEHKLYAPADHRNIFARSMVDAASFVFRDYRNLGNYADFR